jgi:hypothetical protein
MATATEEPKIVGTPNAEIIAAEDAVRNPFTPISPQPFTEGEEAMQGRGPDNRRPTPAYTIGDPVELSDEDKSGVAPILKLLGYKEADVVGYNSATRTVVTKNGGKYQANKKGTQVRHLAGPLSPVQLKEIEAAAAPAEEPAPAEPTSTSSSSSSSSSS